MQNFSSQMEEEFDTKKYFEAQITNLNNQLKSIKELESNIKFPIGSPQYRKLSSKIRMRKKLIYKDLDKYNDICNNITDSIKW